MSEVVEKIKQKAKLGTEIENILDTDLEDEWKQVAEIQWVKLDDVLNILEGKKVVEQEDWDDIIKQREVARWILDGQKQKIRELTDLLNFEKKFAELGLDTKRELSK